MTFVDEIVQMSPSHKLTKSAEVSQQPLHHGKHKRKQLWNFLLFFFFYYFFSALTWKSGLQTDALAVNKSPMMVFVVLFSSDCNLQAWLVQVDGGVDLLSVFKQWPFSKEQN